MSTNRPCAHADHSRRGHIAQGPQTAGGGSRAGALIGAAQRTREEHDARDGRRHAAAEGLEGVVGDLVRGSLLLVVSARGDLRRRGDT